MTVDRIGYIIKLLRKRQIRLFLNNDQLEYEAPKGALTSTIKVLLKNNKEKIIKRLWPPAPTALPPPQSPYFNPTSMGTCGLINGDSRAVLKKMPDNFVDCMITDPPYGLGFMNKAWDKGVPSVDIWKECLRVLKPGSFAFIMTSPRQDVLSQMVNNLAAAGFRTRFTSLYWTYPSGYTKATNISKAVDKKMGASREVLGRNPNSRENSTQLNTIYESGTVGKTDYITKPKTEEAKKLEGAYASYDPKPAVEVILVAMKPLDQKSYTDQALSNGKGVSWFDDCTIPLSETEKGKPRRPANLLVSDNVLDGKNAPMKGHSRYFSLDAWAEKTVPFLMVAKASKKEKEVGLEGFKKRVIMGRDFGQDQRNNPYKIRPKERANIHPTVKPLKLMAYLITMGSREGDIILDPFCGTGTTNIAALMLNRKSIGIEKETAYYEIAEARIRYWSRQRYQN